jgi:hypothetical protein
VLWLDAYPLFPGTPWLLLLETAGATANADARVALTLEANGLLLSGADDGTPGTREIEDGTLDLFDDMVLIGLMMRIACAEG